MRMRLEISRVVRVPPPTRAGGATRAAGRRPARAGRRPARRAIAATGATIALAAIWLLGLPAAAGVAAGAHSTRTTSLSETAHLRLTSKHAFTLNEQGTVSGTIVGAIYIHLHIADNHGGVSAEVNIYPHGSSLSGSGSASYEVEGADAVFSGRLSITRGTGSYANAHASDLRFTGDIQRRTDAVTVQLSGPLSV